MTIQEYRDRYLNTDDTDFPTPTRELVEAWLDEKIEVKEQIDRIFRHHNYGLVWGDFDEHKGDYQHEVEICGMTCDSTKELHIYSGIDLLAKLLGEELTERKYTYEGQTRIEYSIPYKGRRLFQLAHYPLERFEEE